MSTKATTRNCLLLAIAALALPGCDTVTRQELTAHTHDEFEHTHTAHEVQGSEEGCYTITVIESGMPHAAVTDQFCVEERDGVMFLIPSVGMDDWTPTIELTRIGQSSNFVFDVNIDNHPIGSDHMNAHNGVYRLNIVTSAGPTRARIRALGAPVEGGPIHGGVAHALQ